MGLYEERLQRTFDAISMKKVDKIPFSYSGPAYIARIQGLSIAEHLTQIERATNAVIDFLHDHPGIDTMHNPVQNPYGLSILWLSQIKLPGEELPDEGDVRVTFDDSIIADTAASKASDMAEVGVTMHAWEYRMKWYGEDEVTARERAKGLGCGNVTALEV